MMDLFVFGYSEALVVLCIRWDRIPSCAAHSGGYIYNSCPKTPCSYPTPSHAIQTLLQHCFCIEFARGQNNQTYQNNKDTTAKNPSQTFQPTPVRSAIRSIRLIVPRTRCLALSKESFIVSASFEESRISSPIATVICSSPLLAIAWRTGRFSSLHLHPLTF